VLKNDYLTWLQKGKAEKKKQSKVVQENHFGRREEGSRKKTLSITKNKTTSEESIAMGKKAMKLYGGWGERGRDSNTREEPKLKLKNATSRRPTTQELEGRVPEAREGLWHNQER